MTYRLPSGASVQTFRIGAEVEFVTRDAAGYVVSTARLSHAQAAPLIQSIERSALSA